MRCFNAGVCVAGTALSTLLSLSGCAELPISPLPSFQNPLFAPTKGIPVSMVEKQIQCELREFLEEMDSGHLSAPSGETDIARDYLAFDSAAAVTLNLQTDQSGKAVFTGLDV